jgi:hypothetical protein
MINKGAFLSKFSKIKKAAGGSIHDFRSMAAPRRSDLGDVPGGCRRLRSDELQTGAAPGAWIAKNKLPNLRRVSWIVPDSFPGTKNREKRCLAYSRANMIF